MTRFIKGVKAELKLSGGGAQLTFWQTVISTGLPPEGGVPAKDGTVFSFRPAPHPAEAGVLMGAFNPGRRR